MRFASTFTSILALPALFALGWAGAADLTNAFSGNWHLNVEKSKWGTTSKPHSVALSIEQRGQEIRYSGSVIYANEDTRSFAFTGAFDGKPYKMTRSFGDGEIVLKQVDEFTFESTFKTDNGSYTETARTSVSRDGKTLTRRLSVRSSEGTKSWTEIYERR